MFNPFALQSWGATVAEVERPMAGDDHVPGAVLNATRSISIAASSALVFPWLRQMGFKRAGWYSYDWIDNLGRESAREIHDEWQSLQAGDVVPAGPISFTATVVEPNTAFCIVQEQPRLQFSLAFELHPEVAKPGHTRLVSRARARIDLPLGRIATRLLLGPGDGVMVRRQLLGIKERAEALAATEPPPGA